MSSAPAVVSREEWLRARLALLEQEKELTRFRDRVSAQRQALPWVRVDKAYEFETDSGSQSLAELFAGRSQLIVYHFMYAPEWDGPCPSCSLIADHFDGARPHLNARDVTLTAVSRAPLSKLKSLQQRLDWHFPWASSGGSDFNYDMHVSFRPDEIANGQVEYNYATGPVPVEELPGFSVFAKGEDGQVYHTYSSYARGGDLLIGAYNFLDLTPRGRNEKGLKFSMAWVRLHDSYGPGYQVDPLADYTPPNGSCCRTAAVEASAVGAAT